jgi:hypothetical protein
MDGKGPYRIYDPGGSEAKAREDFSYRQLLEENGILRERMKGLKSLGGCFFFWVTCYIIVHHMYTYINVMLCRLKKCTRLGCIKCWATSMKAVFVCS